MTGGSLGSPRVAEEVEREVESRVRPPALECTLMRPLRYSINVTLDGCCDHRVMVPDEELHRHAVENIDRADALLFGRVTYEMMEAAFRPPAQAGARPEWLRRRQTSGARRSERSGEGRSEKSP